eukprot:s5607_g4.t1
MKRREARCQQCALDFRVAKCLESLRGPEDAHSSGKATVACVWKALAEQFCVKLQQDGLTVSIAPDSKFEGNKGGQKEKKDRGQVVMLPAAALSGMASPDRSYESMRQTLQDTQKRCELMLTRVQKESEANRGLAKAREAAEETSRKLADQVNQLTEKVSEAIRQKGKAEEQLEDVQKRCQIETDLREKGSLHACRQNALSIQRLHGRRCIRDGFSLGRSGAGRQRGIFDRPDYYDRVFGDLGQGEFLEWYNVDLQDLKPILGAHRARRVLDLGCGTSRLPMQLAHARPAPRVVVGCDASVAAIARQRGMVMQSRTPGQSRLLFVAADAARLPFRNGCFDLIIEKGFLDALHSTRLGERQVHTVLTEAWRALAAGGSLISVSQHGQLTPPDERLQLFKEAKLQPLPQATREVGRLHNCGLICVQATKPKKCSFQTDFERRIATVHNEADARCAALQAGLVNKLHCMRRVLDKPMKESNKKKKRHLEKDAKEKSRSKKDKKEHKHGKRLREGMGLGPSVSV